MKIDLEYQVCLVTTLGEPEKKKWVITKTLTVSGVRGHFETIAEFIDEIEARQFKEYVGSQGVHV